MEIEIIRKLIEEIRYKNEREIQISPSNKHEYVVMIDALDKQISQEVDYSELNCSGLPIARCPACKSKGHSYPDMYCKDCGQALRW